MSTPHATTLLQAEVARLALKAADSALVQRRRGSRESARRLYYHAHSLLRTLRRHFEVRPAAA